MTDENIPPVSDDTLAELLELEAKATPGEWSTPHFTDESVNCQCVYVLSEGYAGSVCDISVDNGLPISGGGNDAPPLDEAKANARLIPASRNSLRSIVRELQERRAAEKKEWRMRTLPGVSAYEGVIESEEAADRWMEKWPNTWKKQYRIAAGPWIDAEPARAEKESR